MFFPIGDQQVHGGYKPYFSYGLLALNIIISIFLFVGVDINTYENVIYQFGSIPADTTSGDNLHTLLTSMFLHGGWMHLIGNMMYLWIFGDNIEASIGNINFLGFYIIGGLAAHAAHIFFNWNSAIPTVGASGAIAAVMGAYIVMYPHSRIKTLVLYFFVNIPAIVFLGIWIAQQLISGTGDLVASADAAGVAWWAHIGGFAFGALAGAYFRMTGQVGDLRGA